MIVVSIIEGHYLFLPAVAVSVLVITSTLRFHFYMYRVEERLRKLKRFQWRREFSKTHDYISSSSDYDGIEYQVWQNKKTKQFIEI